jgi:hypothetical protein
MRKLLGTLCVALIAAATVATRAEAAPITYVATDLVDVNPGEDLWQYTYDATGLGFSTPGQGFTIYYNYTLYSSLAHVSSPPNWSPLIAQPDPTFSLDGFFDAFLTSPGAAAPFIVNFVWLGSGKPGSQPYDVYTVDPNNPNGGFLSGPTPAGNTVPANAAVPEPGTMVLMGSGVLALARRVRRRSR